jgi:hypothetical protein
MFRASIAHHQEVRCMYVANGTSKASVSESCCLSYMFIVRVVYPTSCLSYVVFTLMWFIVRDVYPTCLS